MDGQGNLERTWKVREKSGNLKIHVNGYGRLSSENFPPHWGLLLKERICSLKSNT